MSQEAIVEEVVMKLKGTMVIEMTDENTGEIETITEENMVTNAVNHILGLNPMGVFYATSDQYDSHVQWNDVLLPICPNMIGGILLYPSALMEDADNIYPSSGGLPIAYASNDVNATEDTARGSMNLTESRAIEDGYKFVWEFTPSQGNGTIAAVALTSAKGGNSVFGNTVNSTNGYLKIREVKLDSLTNDELALLYTAVEIDFENNLMYSIRYVDSSVIVRKMRLPVFSVGLNDRLNDRTVTILEETVLHCNEFSFTTGYTPYGDFVDGHNGYWYGFSNSPNSSGDATMKWIKIKKSDLTYTEGTWTLSNVRARAVGSFKLDTYVNRAVRSVIRNGYLYLQNYDLDGVYKINLNNITDVTLISLGFTSANKALSSSSTSQCMMTLINDFIIAYDFIITADDVVVPLAGAARFPYLGTPIFQYKEFLTGFGGNYGSDYQTMWLLMPYLATINNLSQALVKNADKTMKITYTLTEQT